MFPGRKRMADGIDHAKWAEETSGSTCKFTPNDSGGALALVDPVGLGPHGPETQRKQLTAIWAMAEVTTALLGRGILVWHTSRRYPAWSPGLADPLGACPIIRL